MFCPQCGNLCTPTDTVCTQCGYRLEEAARRLRSSSPPPAAEGAAPVRIPPPTPMSGFEPTTAMPAVPGPMPGMSSTPTPLPIQARSPLGTMLGVAVPVPGSPGAPPLPPSPLRVPPAGASSPQPSWPASSPPPRPSSSPPRFSTMLGVAPAGAGNHMPPSLRIELELLPALRRMLDRSYRAPAETVADTVLRHGLAALADRHHLEQELWSEYARDVRLILCALEEGVPQRLSERGEALEMADLYEAARELAHTRGLAEEAAEYAVAVWAAAICGLLRPARR